MSLDPRTPVDPVDRIAYELRDLREQIAALKAPSGTALFRTVERLEGLITDIQTELDTYNADRYTNAQIDAAIAAPRDVEATSLRVTGDSDLDGTIDSTGTADRIINTGSWATMVVRTDAGGKGQIGYNPSTLDSKVIDGDLDLDLAALASALKPVRFRYKLGDDEVDTTPRVGLIAERVAEVLPELVVLDADGEPLTIDYALTGVAALALLGDMAERIRRLEGGA